MPRERGWCSLLLTATDVSMWDVTKGSQRGWRDVLTMPSMFPSVVLLELLLVSSIARGETSDSPDSSSLLVLREAPTNDAAQTSVETETLGSWGFIAGLRLGLTAPGGPATKEYFGAGFVGRADLGVRFARFFGVKTYFSTGVLSTEALRDFQNSSPVPITTAARSSVQEAGLVFLAMTEPSVLGVLGEIGFAPFMRYNWSQDFEMQGAEACRNYGASNGYAFRLGGGVSIPLARNVVLVPRLGASVGQLSSSTSTYGCDGNAELPDPLVVLPDKALHYSIFLGIGTDLYFGDTWFQ